MELNVFPNNPSEGDTVTVNGVFYKYTSGVWNVVSKVKTNLRERVKHQAAEAGYNLVDGSFEEGGTLASATDVLWYQVDGKYYSWFNGSAKTVVAGSTPATSGGIGAGEWVDRTDVTLRSELQEWRDDHILIADYLTLDGTTDDTAALNELTKSAISGSKAVDLGTGGWTSRVLNASLNDYTLGQAVSGDFQREHVRSFVGRGGKYLSPAFKATDSATSSDYVLIGNNSVGVRLGNFRVHGNNKSKGANFAFIGNAGDGVAPSNGNEIFNIWCENFVGLGLNLDQCHDSDIHGIFTRNGGPSSTTVAVSLQGAGGFLSLRDSVIYGGRLRMACQNGLLTNVVISGLELSGAGYNIVGMKGVHFIGLDTYAIYSSATGNATFAIEVEDAYFPTSLTTGYIQGRFWRGGKFKNCRFTSGIITQNIIAAAGTGQKPRFVFENCKFATTPSYDSTNAEHVFINCENPDGSKLNTSDTLQIQLPVSSVNIGTLSALASNEQFNAGADKWSRFSGAVSGLTPQAAKGLYIGYNRSSGRGETCLAYHDGGGSAGGIETANFSSGSLVLEWFLRGGYLAPATDNIRSIGTATLRPSVIYSATGTINTSDEREKAFEDIDSAEKSAALEIKSAIRKFKWHKSTDEKGDGARWHFGVGAQTVGSIMEKHGLNPSMYGFWCYDEWDAEYAPVMTDIVDAEGFVIGQEKTGEVVCTLEAGNRYGIRYDELAMFILSAIDM